MLVLWSFAFLGYAEKKVFLLTGSRYVEGQEPWNAWKRAADLYLNKNYDTGSTKTPVSDGSIRRDGRD